MIINQELGSLYNFICKINPEAKIYYDEIPETLAIPSMYFPLPEEVNPDQDSLSSYEAKNQIYIVFYERTTRVAMDKATQVARAISNRGNKLPLLNEDGTLAARSLRIVDISAKTVDKGVSQVFLSWKKYYYFDSIQFDTEKFTKFILEGGLKNNGKY